ncbi:MAG: alpha/beta fold hydrolase [Chloroflexota bacterium]
MPTKTVVFVHGLFMSCNSWQHWVTYFERQGYSAQAIAWPGRDKSVKQLLAEHPNPEVGQQTFAAMIEHHEQVIRSLDEPPIIIGHSLGGLVTQLMLNRGLGAAGIAIDSAPPKGVISTEWSFIKSAWPLVNPFNPASRPYLMPFEGFQYAFANGMPLDEQKRAYEQVVPESIRLARGSLTADAAIDFKRQHTPLLMIAGEIDHIIPASLVRKNAKRYEASKPSVTEIHEFAGRNHALVGAKGWEEIADYSLAWIAKHGV